MISLTFMVSSGIAGASTILVSHEYGRHNFARMRRYAHAALRLAMVFMAGAAAIYALFGAQIASVFTPDKAVIEVARQLFFVVAVFEIFDGLQVTALGALRGITDVKRRWCMPSFPTFLSPYPSVTSPASCSASGLPGYFPGSVAGLCLPPRSLSAGSTKVAVK